MAARTKLTKDLKKVELKFLFNLTKRQFIFVSVGIALALFSYISFISFMPLDIALVLMAIIFAPIGIMGFIKIDGLGLEKHLYFYLKRKLNSKFRVYKIENNYRKIQKKYLNRKEKNLENRKEIQKKSNTKNI